MIVTIIKICLSVDSICIVFGLISNVLLHSDVHSLTILYPFVLIRMYMSIWCSLTLRVCTLVFVGGQLLPVGCNVGLLIFQLDAQVLPGGPFPHLSRWWDTQHSVTPSHTLQGLMCVCLCVSQSMHVCVFCLFQKFPYTWYATLCIFYMPYESRLHWISHIGFVCMPTQ